MMRSCRVAFAGSPGRAAAKTVLTWRRSSGR